MSASINTTVWPSCASAVPRLADVVVLPTPPLPDVMTIARPLPMTDSLDAGREVSRQPAVVVLDDDRVAGRICDLGVRSSRGAIGCTHDHAPDAKLLRLEPKREGETDGLADAGVGPGRPAA